MPLSRRYWTYCFPSNFLAVKDISRLLGIDDYNGPKTYISCSTTSLSKARGPSESIRSFAGLAKAQLANEAMRRYAVIALMRTLKLSGTK